MKATKPQHRVPAFTKINGKLIRTTTIRGRIETASRYVSVGRMSDKVWPIVVRHNGGKPEVLAFSHPSAGKQFVKGTIEPEESPLDAAIRELREESGIRSEAPMRHLGILSVGESHWHFYECRISGLPEAWLHQTEDDFGHSFAFFWHPLDDPLDADWHPMFHKAFACLAKLFAE